MEKDLVLYYYGECEETRRKELERHLESCAPCRDFLDDLRKILPATARRDEPPESFWEDYSREMRRKLWSAEPKVPWWQRIFLRPWPLPAVAMALVLALAVTLTFTRRLWWPELPPRETAVLEVMPMVENLEFFTVMDMLEAMEFLEAA